MTEKTPPTPRVSVCLPVWNGERFLEEAIESVLAQTVNDFELIVSDDNSSDSSMSILKRLQQKDSRIKILEQKKRAGLFANYNKCILESRAPVIKFFAQDDLLEPDHLKRVLEIFESHPEVNLVSCNKLLVNEDSEITRSEKQDTPVNYFESAGDSAIEGETIQKVLLETFSNFIGEPVTVSIRAQKNELFDEAFNHCGDLEYWTRLLSKGSYFYINEELCKFRRHNNSATTYNTKQMNSVFDLLRLQKKFEKLSESLLIDLDKQRESLIVALSSFVYQQSSTGCLSLDDIRSQPLDTFNTGDRALLSVLENDLMLMRELLYHSLNRLGELEGKFSINGRQFSKMLANEKEITSLEQEITALLSSLSWKSTKPLRDINARIFSLDNKDSYDFKGISYSPEEDADEILARQFRYLDYLQVLKSEIQESRSWHLSAVLRIFSS